MNTHDKIELPPLPPGCPTYEFPDGGYDEDEMQAYARAAIEPYVKRIVELEAARKRRGEPVVQFRKEHCADWYDGYPDHSDGGGPYETRTLYTTPQPAEPVKVPRN